MNKQDLVPSYIESDFSSSLLKSAELLRNHNTFKDYNYQGSNISMLLQLYSYLADHSSYYTNMVAKNMFMDSANIYETVHGLAAQKGYQALGFRSAYTTMTITLSGGLDLFSHGDEIVIRPWKTINPQEMNNEKESLYYTTTKEVSYIVKHNEPITFQFPLKEGTIERYSYRGDDIVDNSIVLPGRNYDHGYFPFDVPSISVRVNGEEWVRVNEIYDRISGLNDTTENGNVYTFVFDKYQRYKIQFSETFNRPNPTSTIEITVLRSKGSGGSVGSNVITLGKADLKNLLIENITKTNIDNTGFITNTVIPESAIVEFYNPESSIGGDNPEIVEQLKQNSRANVHSQFRNITKRDYKYYLEGRSDTAKATAWGEQEQDPGNVEEYNKVYISLIPEIGNGSMFRNGTISTSGALWVEQDDPDLYYDVEIPIAYNTDFRDNLLVYLEPRKMLNVYEVPVIPDIVYFRFDIGVRTRRTFNFTDVTTSIKEKLTFFFDRMNREFGEVINFMDIENFILDQDIVSDKYDFRYIPGIQNFVMREVSTFTPLAPSGDQYTIYEPNDESLYPQYIVENKEGYVDNKLRPIKLRYNQFAMLVINMCRFNSENIRQ